MPLLSRDAQPLLRKVGGKPSSTTDPLAAAAASPSSPSTTKTPSLVPKPAPLPEGRSVSDEPESSSGKSLPSPPYKPLHGRKGLPKPPSYVGQGAIRKRTRAAKEEEAEAAGGAKSTDTQDSGPGGVGESDDMDLFGEMGAPPPKQRKMTYTATTGRSFVNGKAKKKAAAAAGYGGRAGAKSANSTPVKNIHAHAGASAAASTGRAAAKADKKGMPFPHSSSNTMTVPSERLPGVCDGGGEMGERRSGKLKTLDPIAFPQSSLRERPGTVNLQSGEEISPGEKPRVKLLPGIEYLTATGKENKGMLKKLPPIDPSPQPKSPRKVMKLPPSKHLPRLPRDSTRGSTSSSRSQGCEIIDLSTPSERTQLNNPTSGTQIQKAPDTPTTRKTLKALPSIEGTKPTRRSSRHTAAKGQTEAAEAANDHPLLQKACANDDHGHDFASLRVSNPLVADDDLLDDDEEEDDERNPNGNYQAPAKCPVCNAPVDRILLEEWQGNQPFMRIQKQMAFCEEHRRAAAREEYAAREYPEIDFEALAPDPTLVKKEEDELKTEDDGDGSGADAGTGAGAAAASSAGGRIERFRADLVAIVRREQPSAFREAAEEAARRGAGRNLKTTSAADEALTGMSVGYYGPRGRRVMEAWVTRELADDIRQAAGCDRLIGYKTVSGFIQEVLVPELATRLVVEDLDVGEARAREVLRESGEIGELVHWVNDEEGGAAKVAAAGEDDDDEGDY